MTVAEERLMTAMAEIFRLDDAIEEERITAVEGAVEQGHLSVKVLMVTDEFVLLKAFRKKGLIDPVHKHDDHVSVATLVSGRMRMTIGDEEFIAEPGSVWRHDRGVVHQSEALEDCVQIEIKAPPCKTWR